MLKRIIIGVFLLITSITWAQEGTSSPYSFYGIGTLKFKGTAENRMMGGISVFGDSIHVNLQNPAALADLELVNFTVGGSHKYVTQKTDLESQKQSTTSLDYLAMGIPMGKLVASFGLIPYTSVGYDIESVSGDVTTRYTGEGGLNKAFLTFAYRVTPNFSLGVDTNYNFGNIQNTAFSVQDGLELASRENNRSDLLGFSFNLAARYKTMVTEDLELTTSFIYTPETNFESENTRQRSTLFVVPSTGTTIVREEIEVAVENTDFTFPSQWTLGAGIGKPKHWAIGAEYTDQKTSNFTNRTFELENVSFTDASKFRVGGYFIPNYNSLGNYYKRVVYRAGIRFEETGINLNGQDINEFGISFGVGLPVGRLFSNVNLGFEIGRRGTTDFGLIQENFFNTFLSFSLNDRWFDKRYLD
ncbi:membrane protein [Patiriisocius marinistellae]|uniref:Membrane protein n=1 Tax=Patiriisocius marinistellae TaxID=2494560 RepID=A0A5J4FW12_9FLAO|nr:hypothetical protein [Patiriisocius marinistellae]GEQ85352.1 membrane protein [Patiriisocius marinistellae]